MHVSERYVIVVGPADGEMDRVFKRAVVRPELAGDQAIAGGSVIRRQWRDR